MSEFGDVDDLFEELFGFAERVLQEPLGVLSPEMPKLDAVHRGEPDEVIAGAKEVAYLLQAPGYDSEDFLVSVYDDSLEVKTRDFIRRKMLGAKVHPESAVRTYRNGVLSVRMKRRGV